jgi:hypothetical protein
MNRRLEEAIADWDREVEAEAVKLIKSGTPPFDAMERARKTVERRRQQAAEQP